MSDENLWGEADRFDFKLIIPEEIPQDMLLQRTCDVYLSDESPIMVIADSNSMGSTLPESQSASESTVAPKTQFPSSETFLLVDDTPDRFFASNAEFEQQLARQRKTKPVMETQVAKRLTVEEKMSKKMAEEALGLMYKKKKTTAVAFVAVLKPSKRKDKIKQGLL